MFDFNKIKMRPRSSKGYKPAATDEQIAELEKYCGHALPENLKIILRRFNNSSPSATYFDVLDEGGSFPYRYELSSFYYLDENKNLSNNIWWQIKHYGKFMGPDSLPFADDGVQQIYYLKWLNSIPQVWYLTYLDLEEPECTFVMNSLDELLDSLYVGDEE
jgi:hypothetical protein